MALYLVATPIGNLSDITLRAIEILRYVDVVVSEDTRHTKKLLTHLEIQKPSLSFHEHSTRGELNKVLNLLREEKNVAYTVDAGTPGVADPGGFLVREVTRELPEVDIIPIPGPSALAAAISIAGLTRDEFLFLGFPPTKKGRKTFFEGVLNAKYSVILYESPHRILKTLSDLCDIGLSMFDGVLIKEISKVYEKTLRMTIVEMRDFLEKEKRIKGEFVLVINKDSKSVKHLA
ncbi:MAG: 16S rRNA (cytidine(1402)-2'-O)-methyltransferase [bacterium]|nr:16S rRNA (cytidine(1402)-2'-O)-methyltransferase [bacterium]